MEDGSGFAYLWKMPNPQRRTLTFEEYLELARSASVKYEYHAGTVVEMSGATIPHIRITFDTGKYVLIDQTKREVQTFTRYPDIWGLREFSVPDEFGDIQPLDLKISMDAIYARVLF